MNYLQNQATTYSLRDFTQLRDFLNKSFNLSDINGETSYVITNKGELYQHFTENVFSFDISDYKFDDINMFYQDFQRTFEENFSKTKLPTSRELENGNYMYSRIENKGMEPEFEQYAYAAFNEMDIDILLENESRCWQMARIIFDHRKRVSSSLAALCMNRMFSKNFQTSMIKYQNKKKTKLAFKEFREAFSLK